MYYTALEDASIDLCGLASTDRLPRAAFRDGLIGQIVEQLRAGRCVLLTGPAGVGKTAVIHGLAHALTDDPVGLRQLSTPSIISGTKYLGEWQTKAGRVCEQAIERNAVLYVTDVENLVHTGKSSNDPSNLWDAMAPYRDSGRLLLIGEASPEIVEQIQRYPRLAKVFVAIEVPPLTDPQVRAVVRQSVTAQSLSESTCEALIDLTSRFMPARPQPGPACNLLAQVLDYQAQKAAIGEPVPLDVELIERVMSIYSGLPRFVISHSAQRTASEIRDWFRERLVGQRAAIEAVVETIALFKAGVNDPQRPIGTFLFVGPTGVGKTELARLLAEFLFGSSTRLLRFDLSEFKDYHSFQLLIGNPEQPEQPAKLLDAVRRQPFQVILFDELEKAHPNIRDLLLGLLDEGRLAPPRGAAVDCRRTILIATSNVGADLAAAKGLGFADAALDDDAVAERHAQQIRQALEQEFRPEFLNRFQHVVVFHPLSSAQLLHVAKFELSQVLGRHGLAQRNLVVDVPDELLQQVVTRGVNEKYGARSLKRAIQRELVVPLAMTLTDQRVEAGSILRFEPRGERGVRVRVLATADAKTARKARQQQEQTALRAVTQAGLLAALDDHAAQIAEIATARDETFVQSELARLDVLRAEPAFWDNPRWAAATMRDIERHQEILDRLARLRDWITEQQVVLQGETLTRRELDRSAASLDRLQGAVTSCRRELLHFDADDHLDAIIRVAGVGGAAGRRMRDLLVTTYRDWAAERQLRVDWICEPCSDDEPACFAVRGPYAVGYLRGEAGLHQMKHDDLQSVARVAVLGWRDDPDLLGRAEIVRARALKATGQFGGRVRSRLECAAELILQNSLTLNENQVFAGELVHAWTAGSFDSGEIVRRYDTAPFLIRDVLTGVSSGRPDSLSATRFHDLLAQRVDASHRH